MQQILPDTPQTVEFVSNKQSNAIVTWFVEMHKAFLCSINGLSDISS